VDEKACDIRFDIFLKPVCRIWNEDVPVSGFIHRLADQNIPFIIENHDGTEWVIYDECDVDTITAIERDLGIWIIDLLNKKY
jgi:hypothetical protein